MTDPAVPAQAGKEATWQPTRKRAATLVAVAFLASAAITGVLYAWELPPFRGNIVRTNNAYVRGRTTIISPQVSGYVLKVHARDFQVVKAGDLLVEIDSRVYGARVEQARANLNAARAALSNNDQARAARIAAKQSQFAAVASAKAQLIRAQADMRRGDDLVQDGSLSRREYDQTVAALQQAQAQFRQAMASDEVAHQDILTVQVGRDGLIAQMQAAEAQLKLAEIDLDHAIIRAPEDGRLGEIGVREGQYVTNGTQLFSLVPQDLWVIANYKESQIAQVKAGQTAKFSVDALADATLKGHVEELAPAAGSEFAVLKPDNATGNFVKVPQRVAVRISVDSGQPLAANLKPGMSVEMRIDTSEKRP
jgi:multidrug resistance efflux pump